jgi:hypothetical protein
LANARPLSTVKRNAYNALWDRLRNEDAALRTLTEHGLTSVPLSYFDDLLVSCVTADWRKVARVLGEALVETWESGFFQVGEVVLAARIRSLAASGRIAGRGDLSNASFSEVRMPAAEPAPAPLGLSSVSQ